jgi:hypothetical protein
LNLFFICLIAVHYFAERQIGDARQRLFRFFNLFFNLFFICLIVIHSFAERQIGDARQIISNNVSCMTKKCLKEKTKKFLCRAPNVSARQRGAFAERPALGARQRWLFAECQPWR